MEKSVDFAFWLRGDDVGYAIELDWCEETKVDKIALHKRLIDGLDRLKENYETFHIPNAEFSERRYAYGVFGRDARVLAITNPLSCEEISAVELKRLGNEEGSRVVSRKE